MQLSGLRFSESDPKAALPAPDGAQELPGDAPKHPRLVASDSPLRDHQETVRPECGLTNSQLLDLFA